MQVEINDIEKGKKELTISITASAIEVKYTETLNKYRKNIAINGFRKGKVPLSLLKRMLGDKVHEEVIEDIIPDALQDAVKQHKIQVISKPEISDVQYSPETGLKFKALLEVGPEYETVTYKDFEFEKELYQVDDSDVERSIDHILEDRAVINSVEGEVSKGHFVISDLQQIDDAGLPIIGEKLENKVLLVDDSDENKYALPLIGAKVGEKRRLTINIAPNPEAGSTERKDEYFDVHIKDIKERILPELNEDFVKSIGNFDTVEAFRDKLKEDLQLEAESYSKSKFNNAVADMLVKNNPIELPAALIDSYLSVMVENAKKNSEREFDEQDLRTRLRPDAIWNLKWQMIREKIEELEQIEIGDADIEAFITETAAGKETNEIRLRNRYKNESERSKLIDHLKEQRIIQIILENSKVKDKNVPYKSLFESRIEQE
ncbi:trigger factor [candidate division KSB1 bacterium]|nr:trigger factor [candidate division KSB1 bacterium]